MRIKSTDYVSNEGRIYARQILTCRKKDCSNFGKDVKTIYNPLGNVVEDSNAEVEEA